jgi:hypothetical protein
MTKSAKLFFSILLFLPLVAGVDLEWPVADIQPIRFFGQRSDGVMESGITGKQADTVRAAGNGTLLLTMQSNSNMNGFPGTLGNAVIIAHDEGLLSVYGNLDAVDRVSGLVEIESQTFLSATGTSAWGFPHECIFQVVDNEKKTYLNPLLLLPALKDNRAPLVKNVILISGNKQSFPLGTARMVKQGKYKLYASVTDSIDTGNAELSPFRVTVQVNGSEQATIPFEMMHETGGLLFLSTSEYTWANLYADPDRMFLGDLSLSRGKADILIIARDIAGNERTFPFTLQIE